jgi:hypothetical protein
VRRLCFSLLLLLCASGVQAQTVNSDTDFQLWNDTQFIVPLTKKKDWNFIVWTFGRFGNDVQTTTDARAGGLISKKVNKYLTLSGGYLYRYANPTFRQRRYEHRYLGIGALTIPLGGKFTLVNRNMFQYEDRSSRPDATLIRNRFWLKREVKIAKKAIEPFGAIETFYDATNRELARTRYQAGFSRKFNARFGADFFYVRQNEGGNRAGTLNGIGSSFRVNF